MDDLSKMAKLHGCFVQVGKIAWMFCPGWQNCMDVLSRMAKLHGSFVQGGKYVLDVLSWVAKNGMGCFVIWDVLSYGMICPNVFSTF